MTPIVQNFIDTVETYRALNVRDSERVKYTPALAEYVLSTNMNNRNVQKRVVTTYAADMKNDRWHYNGETIKIDVDGNLIDGQHRMLAVIEAGVAVEMLTVFGLPREVRRTVDMGKARTVVDLSHMRGGLNGTKLAAIARQLLMYEHGVYRTSGNRSYVPTKIETDDYMQEHAIELDDALHHCRRPFMPFSGLTTSMSAAYVIIMRKHPELREVIKDFFTSVIDNVSLVPETGAHTLRRTLERLNKAQQGSERVEIILRGWIAHKNGRKCHLIRTSQEWPKEKEL